MDQNGSGAASQRRIRTKPKIFPYHDDGSVYGSIMDPDHLYTDPAPTIRTNCMQIQPRIRVPDQVIHCITHNNNLPELGIRRQFQVEKCKITGNLNPKVTTDHFFRIMKFAKTRITDPPS
jgi:hypothetical protein